jgi:hypothetical protein
VAGQQELAESHAVSRDTVQRVLQRAREHWGKQRWMTDLRQEIATLLDKSAGVMTTAEMTTAMLTARGSAAEEPQRSRWAAAIACATVDTEMTREGARYTLHRGAQRLFIVAMPGLTDAHTAAPATRALCRGARGASRRHRRH